MALVPLLALVAAPPATSQEPETEKDRVDRIMADYSGTETPGAVVAIVRDGRIVFQRAYGMANLTHGIPFTVDTRTNIGSTSKQFTAFAIALLADRGQLSLDDDVRTHIPELPDLGEVVRLRHLVGHTSGYREFLNALAIGGWRFSPLDHIDRDEILTVVQRQPALQNSPGAEYNYNNTGYALLALVVERVTGEPFRDWMRANVFEPLGMNATAIRGDPQRIVPNSAQGYGPVGEDGADGFREIFDIPSAMGAGGIYTTVGDLALWMRNLRTAELGGPALMERMTTRNVLTTGDTTSYAMGLIVSRSRGLGMVQHGGADAAHRSTFIYYPDLDAGLIVQSNHAEFDGTIPGRIAEVFFGAHMEPREDSAVADMTFDPALFDTETFDAYAGRYELEVQPGFILTFWRDEDRLMAQATGQAAFELAPTSDSTFALSVVQASITFHRDEDGRVTSLTLHQNGDHIAHRLTDVETEALDLSPYVGRYYSAEFETFYDVVIEDDHLVVRHRRLPPMNLDHASDDVFTGSFPLARVEFDRDPDGRVTGLRASNGRARDILFRRTDWPAKTDYEYGPDRRNETDVTILEARTSSRFRRAGTGHGGASPGHPLRG
jgi:CubicO group peptidase (beta-lactamase class C family)